MKKPERLENERVSSTGPQKQRSVGKKYLATQGTRNHPAVAAAKKSLKRQPEQKSRRSLQLEKQQNPKPPTPAENVREVEKIPRYN
jgi:hypothetical protein